MVYACCVPDCGNKPSKRSIMKFYTFPRDRSRRQKWLQSLKLIKTENDEFTGNTNKMTVCSEHFKESDFYMAGMLKKVRKKSIPSSLTKIPTVNITSDETSFELPTDTSSWGFMVVDNESLQTSEISTDDLNIGHVKTTETEGENWSSSVYLIRSHLGSSSCKNKQKFICDRSNVEAYLCGFCDFETYHLVFLKKHIKDCSKFGKTEEQNVKEYKCCYCQFQSYSVMVWLLHMKNSCVEANNSCKHLKRHANNEHVHNKHLSKDEVKFFECKHCDYRGKTNGLLKSHILHKYSRDDEINWMKCEHCDYKCKRQEHLKSHVIYKHLSEDEIEWFECNQCDFRGKSKSILKTHLTNAKRIHS